MLKQVLDHISKHVLIYGIGLSVFLLLVAVLNSFSKQPSGVIEPVQYKHSVAGSYGINVGSSPESDVTKLGKIVAKKDISDGGTRYDLEYNKIVLIDQGKIVFVKYHPSPFEKKAIAKNVSGRAHDFVMFYEEHGYEAHVYLKDGVVVVHNKGEDPNEDAFIIEVRYFVPASKGDFMARYAEGLYENESDIPSEGY